MTKLYLLMRRSLTVFLMFGAMVSFAQGQVTGKVTSSEDGSGLPGVTVLEKGTGNGTVTDADGSYSVKVGANATLVFSFVGYKTQEVAVGSQNSINILLESDVTALSEVVVVGYGSQEKRDVTGATISLKPGDFNGGVISSPEQLIQGRAAGVQITSASGEPGAAVNIRIRGTSSVNANNNPLFVIDGVPLSGDDVSPGTSGQTIGNSPARNPLNFLNPSDIASIDVLKDASATAIYGSRGANGVVLITTKSGKIGKPILEYSYSASISNITKKYDLLDAKGFIDGYTKLRDAASAVLQNKGFNTDWQDAILRTAYSNSHNLSYGAADKGGDYRFSFGTLTQQGIIQKSDLTRYTVRFNGNKKFLNDKLKISTQMTVSSTKDGNVPISNNGGFEGDLFGSALKFNPTAPIYNSDGSLYQPSITEPNPVAYIKLTKSYTNTLRALGNVSAEIEIAKGFSFKTVLGFDKSFSSRKSAYSSDLKATTGIFGIGRLYANDVQADNKLWENYFTYDTKIGSDLKLTALLGYSYQSFGYSSQGYQFASFQTNDLDQMINNYASAKVSTATNSSSTIDELQSYYARTNWSFKDKYLLTATLRSDGSTRFGGNNKYGYFPSAAFKWRLSDEAFVPEAFSDLNFRVGFGVTGNQNIPHNLYDNRTRFGDASIGSDGVTVSPGGINNVAFANPNLKWESTAQYNIGFDYGLIGNRLRGSIDYYYKDTKDLLIQANSPQPAVNPYVWKNLDADIINKGVELTLEGDAVQTQDFKWTVIANTAINSNKVQNFRGTINTGEINGQGLTGAYSQQIANDQPLFSYFMLNFTGYDANGNSTYSETKARLIGKSALPKVTAGLTNNFKYKAFDLSLFFSGQFGQYIYSNTANAYFTAGSLASGRNVTKDLVGNGEGAGNAPAVSTRFLSDGSFIRLQNVSLGYNAHVNNSVISSLRFNLTGQNLFVITDYIGQDPEVNTNKSLNGIPSAGIDYGAYPRARTFTLSVSATF